MNENANTKQFSVSIVYNGVTKPLEHINPHESVNAVCERAMNLFEIHTNRHTLALWLGAERELSNEQSVEVAGIQADVTLLLRPSAVRGG